MPSLMRDATPVTLAGPRGPRLRGSSALFVATLVFAVGCTKIGPEEELRDRFAYGAAGPGAAALPLATTTLRGTVKFQGVPIEAGWISFQPDDGPGPVITAPIAGGGRFEALGVTIGKVRVELIATQPALPTLFLNMVHAGGIHVDITGDEMDLALELPLPAGS